MTRRYLTDEQELEVARAYANGEHGRQLAERYGVSPRLIYQAVRRAGGTIRTTSESRTGWTGSPEQCAEVISLYKQGQSVHELAAMLKCRTALISEVLADGNVELHPGGRVHPKFRPPQEAQIAAEYSGGETLKSLAERYEVSTPTIANVLRRQGIEMRPPARPTYWTPDRLSTLVAMHDAGQSDRAIADALGRISTTAVNRRLRALGKRSPKKRARGPEHGSWKGGRSVKADGYVLVQCSEADRQFVTPNVSGYVLEHRLVAARALGRKIGREVTVHHIDGDKTNNTLGNLQIRQGQHGAGIAFECRSCGSHDVVAVPLR